MIENYVPVPVTITDLEDLVTLRFQYNPETLRRRYRIRYATHSPVGFPGEIEQYIGNSNMRFPLEVTFTAMNQNEYESLTRARNFLESLANPPDTADSIQTNATSKILVVWPNTLALIARPSEIDLEDKVFDSRGNVLQFEAKLELFEVVTSRPSKQKIRDFGPLRIANAVEI